MLKRLLLIAICISLMSLGVYSLHRNQKSELQVSSTKSIPPASVAVIVVEPAQWRQTLFAIGTIVAEQGIDVVAPLPGSVIDIKFASGEEVVKGQPLIAMDVGIQEAELRGLEATKSLRTLQLDRAKRLRKERQISQSDYDAAQAAFDQAAAEVEAKRAFIIRKTVYAPFSGTLGIRKVDLGTYLDPGDPIVPLQMLNPVHVDYALPEQFFSRLSVGQDVEIELPAYPDQKFLGKISALDPNIDQATRNVRLRATLINTDHKIRPGMFAEVSTIENKPESVIVIPGTAITYSPYGNTVYVVVEDNGESVSERRKIETGGVRDGMVEIKSGLSVGETIVAIGHNKLRNGMIVRVVEEADTEPESVPTILGEK